MTVEMLSTLAPVEPGREQPLRATLETFHRAFPDAERFFPGDTMFYFAKYPPAGSEFALEDLRRSPVWR